jgi:hypothetical protein
MILVIQAPPELESLVERLGIIVLRVNHHGEEPHLLASSQTVMEGIHQEESAQTLPPIPLIYG